MSTANNTKRQQLHHRKLDIIGFQRDDGLWDIEARLLDSKSVGFENHQRGVIKPGEAIHDMTLCITLDLDMVIREVSASSEATPFSMCPNANDAMQRLVGLQIAPGWLREAKQRIPATQSCTHLMELLNPIATTAYQTMHCALEERENAKAKRAPPAILDTCLSLSRQSVVVKHEWPDFYEKPEESTKGL